MVAVPTADAMASTGINPDLYIPEWIGYSLEYAREMLCPTRYFYYFLISNQKLIKPAVTVGTQEKWKSNPT
jgi:hypothetical protein